MKKLSVFKSQLCPVFAVWPEQVLVLSMPLFSHLKYENNNNSTYLIGLVRELCELTYINIKYFKQCLAKSKCNISMN